jgi:phosphopantothenoylcysteine synthetase/decarboxylase
MTTAEDCVIGHEAPLLSCDASPGNTPIHRIVVGIAGSIGAMDVPQSILWLRHVRGVEVRAIMTHQATSMVTPRALAVTSGQPVALDSEGFSGDPVVPHIDLTRWAELLLVYPATANIIGKAAHGIADDLLSTCILASACPVVFVPNMNEQMWSRPVVQRNVATLRADGYGVVAPSRGLAVADGQRTGCVMPEIEEVLAWAERFVQGSTAGRSSNRAQHSEPSGVAHEVLAR